MTPLRVYVAGPMTGLPGFNYPAFREAAQRLRGVGFDVVDPSSLHGDAPAGSLTRDEYLRVDIAALATCNAIAMLEGWRGHEGAECEDHIARALKMVRVCPYTCEILPDWMQRKPRWV